MGWGDGETRRWGDGGTRGQGEEKALEAQSALEAEEEKTKKN